MDITSLLTSGVVAALIAAAISLRTSERKILIENVTLERAKWRAKIRELAGSLESAARNRDTGSLALLRTQVALNVNPFDPEDRAILDTIDGLRAVSVVTDAQVLELSDRLSLLLKHDWDRAKHEAQPWFHKTKLPRRISYSEFRTLSNVDIKAFSEGSQKQENMWGLPAHFLLMMFSAGALFFLAVGLVDPFAELVRLFNNTSIEKTPRDWAGFVGWSLYAGIIWSACYLGFKAGEKRFLEIWFSWKER